MSDIEGESLRKAYFSERDVSTLEEEMVDGNWPFAKSNATTTNKKEESWRAITDYSARFCPPWSPRWLKIRDGGSYIP